MAGNQNTPPSIIIDDEQDIQSEYGGSHEEGRPLKLLLLVQNIYCLGMTNLNNFEKGLNFMKNHPDVVAHPVILQIWFIFNKMFQIFQTHVYEKAGNSQKRLVELRQAEYSWEELTNILKSLLNKKEHKNQEYSFEIVQTVISVIRKAFSQNSETPDCKQVTSLNKSKNSKKRTRTHSVSSCSSSASFNNEDEDEFSKLFKTDKRKSAVVSQVFQYRRGEKRRKLTTPGEEGTHLIKIEITDTKDLKGCKSDKFYWQKVAKKGLFLLNIENEEDSVIYKQIDKILVKVGERVSKTKNVKLDDFTSDFDFKKK